MSFFFFFQAEDGIRDKLVTGVQTCALPICEVKVGGSRSAARSSCTAIELRHREFAMAERLGGGEAAVAGAIVFIFRSHFSPSALRRSMDTRPPAQSSFLILSSWPIPSSFNWPACWHKLMMMEVPRARRLWLA